MHLNKSSDVAFRGRQLERTPNKNDTVKIDHPFQPKITDHDEKTITLKIFHDPFLQVEHLAR